MYIEQLYTGCLAEAAYYIESEKEAAIIDPLRDPAPYIELAKSRGAKIRYVFETHFHADFVSGHVDLAKETGAQIVYGPTAKAGYDIITAEDGQEFTLGHIKIKVLHTPGHTLESSCFLLLDDNDKPHAVFTGDTLFAGDVGRPDLAVTSDITAEDLAKMLYHSLQDKILTLPDDVIVYPGHGAGSQCGKKLDDETITTIGKQKAHNYALQPQSEEAFVKNLITGLATPPQYFPKNAKLNKSGAVAYEEVFEHANKALSPDDFLEHCVQGTLVLDTRPAKQFFKGHLPGSINIGLEGFFAVWVGTLIEDLNTPILLITEPGMEGQTIERLARVGYDNIKGFVKGGFDALNHRQNPEKTAFMDIREFDPSMHEMTLVDVRNVNEFQDNHITGAVNLPLPELQRRLNELDKEDIIHVYCKSGYRSAIACSILQRNGYKKVVNLEGGMERFTNQANELLSA